MKLFLLALFPLLLYSFHLGKVTGDPSPHVVTEEAGGSSSLEEPQQQKPVQDLSWISIYTPVKSCHTDLREKYGEFSPPLFPVGFEGNIWCNWTIWAGSRKHIIIYIKGFRSDESCNVNGDKIFFHGVSSLAENAVIYACWRKEAHVFATYAEGISVVLLLRHSAHLRKERLVLKYYVFKRREMKPPPKGVIGSSEILLPELSRSVLTSLPQSEKESFLSMWDSVNTSLSASHRTDQVTELSKSLPARREDARVADLPSFVWQVTPAIPSLLPMSSMDNEKFSYSPETLIETRGHAGWGHLSESTTRSDGLSYIPHLSSSLLIKTSSFAEGPAPSATSLGPFIMNDPQADSKLVQLDYLALALYSVTVSHSLEATTEVNNDAIHSESVKQFMSTNFQKSVSVPEGVSRDASTSPEQNWITTEMQEDSFLLPSETSERGRQSGSPVLIFSGDHYMSEWESRTAPIPEESTILLDTRPFLKSGVEVTDLLKGSLGITVPCSSPNRRLPPKTRSSCPEAFSAMGNVSPVATEFITSADTSLYLATAVLGESRKINWEGQSSHFLDRTMKPELPFSLDESTMAPVVSTEPEFSVFSQNHDQFSRIKPTHPFSVVELKSSLSHSSEAILSFAIPDQEPTPSAVDSLSPSMLLTNPLHFVEPDQTLSLPELNSLVLSETVLVLSLAVERLGPNLSGLECACSKTAAILETATELENLLSPCVMFLELAVSPTTTVNSLATEHTTSFFSPVNEITPSLGLLTANAAKSESSLSSCSRYVANTLEQEELSLLTVRPSCLVDPTVGVLTHSVSAALTATELEHLFPFTEMVFTKQQLSEGKSNDSFVTMPEEEDEGSLFSDTVKYLNLLSKTERFPSLDGFTANGQSPQNESVTETPLIFLPVTGEENSIMNYAFISSTALTSVLSHTEMQTQAVFPSPLKSVDNTTRPTVQSQEMQPNAEWQKTTLEVAASNLNVPGTLVKALPQKNTADPQTPQPPSDAENKVVSRILWNNIEFGFPWLMVYLPVKSCHITLKDETGTFSPPHFNSIQTNNWCNWTIWAGPDKHILIYIKGFEGKRDCAENQDKILFQGFMSSMENKVVYACQNHGTLTFATQAVAAHVVFLSKAHSRNHGPKYFRGRYYIFEDYEVSTSADGNVVPEEPVLNSNSRIGFPSYIIHSRRISDFKKMGSIPSNENSLPVSSIERWDKTNSASSFEALLRPAVNNYTPLSFLKPTKNVLDMKEMQVVKPSADEYQTGNDALPSRLKKTVVFASNGLEDKEKAMVPSSSPYESQKFRPKTKLMAVGISTQSAGLENNVRVPIHWRPTYTKDAGRAKFERSGFLSGVTYPQASIKERRLPISFPKIIPKGDWYRALQPWHSHAAISKKASDAMEFQQVEMKEGEWLDGQVIREGNGDRYVAIADGVRRNESPGTELYTLNMPDKSATKIKPHLTTFAQLHVFNVLPSLNILNSDLMGTAPTSAPQVVPPDSVFVFRSHENDSILESQHKPGDVLLEVTFGIEHKGWIPHNGSELEEDLIESVKMQVQERVKFLSNKVKEIKLKEIKRKGRSERKRMNDPNLIFTFWLHLVPEEKNISHLIHSQLEGLGGTSTGSGKIRQVSVGDVNECSSGIELCGDEAICLNGYGTYFCQCKEDFEDRSLTKSGTLCVRIPPSGLRFLYSYMEIFVGTMVFFIAVIVVVISVLCTIVKKRRTKKDLSIPGVALTRTPAASRSQPLAFDQSNISNLLSLDPACLKIRARSPEWSHSELGSSPTDVCRVSIEQSECL